MKNIKLVLCDLDGTLLDEDKCLDSNVKEIKKQLEDRGILFSLVSGRNVHIMKDIVKELDIRLPYVTNNGGNIFVGERCICEYGMLREDLLIVFGLLDEAGIPYLAYTNEAIYPRGEHVLLKQFMQRLIGKVDIVNQIEDESLASQSIFKIVIVHEDEGIMSKMMELINTRCKQAHCVRSEGDVYTLTHLEASKGNAVRKLLEMLDIDKEETELINTRCKQAHCVRSEGDVYTLTHLEASKGNAVRKLLEMLDIDKEETVAFGDNYNDITMFEEVGYSIAMANASPTVQMCADAVTLSNQQNGVSYYLKEYLLK